MNPSFFRNHHQFLMALLLMQAPDAGSGGINATAVKPDVGGDWPESGADLPEQMLGDFKILLPGISVFRLPANLAQLWHLITVEDKNPKSKTFGQTVERWQLKLDRSNPLIIESSARAGDIGDALTANFSTVPRPRGKKDDPATAWVADTAYLLDTALADKSRPADPELLKATINKYAGKSVRLQHGLSGQCRADRTVRLEYLDPTDTTFAAEQREQRRVIMEEVDATGAPTGRKGCGKRYYTRDFENKAPRSVDDKYFTEIECSGSYKDGAGVMQPCGAIVRGFPSVDGFLPPLGAK